MKKGKTKKKISQKRSTPRPTARKKALPLSQDELPVVGIGASAGGLEPLEKFFERIPADSGVAFVVVQHTDPHYKSVMDELLGRRTEMTVQMAENRMRINPNTVYVNPPGKYLTLFHGMFYLSDPEPDQGVRFPIDSFLRSLADDRGHRAVSVILSGGGTDGTLGLKAVKAAGGMTMVQEEGSAKFGGMLRSAIASGSVDHVLPVEEMPKELIRYIRHPYTAKSAPPPEEVEPTFVDRLEKIFMVLRSQTGHDFSLYKRNTICRRIERRMALHQFRNISDYLRYLQQNKAEVEALFKELLIGVTSFFRDIESFDALQTKVIPHLCEGREADRPIRIWDAGCSTGEEAYSIALLLNEEMERLGHHYKVHIFATDIDEEALEFARAGLYPEAIAADVSAQRLRRFFDKEGSSYRVKKQIREMIIFAKQDLIKDPPFSKLDLIVCRNLLIYLSGVLQKKVIPLFHYTLNPDGYLVLGPSETIGEQASLFSMIDKKWKIFRRKSSAKVAVEFPTIPVAKETAGPLKKETRSAESDVVRVAEKLLLDEYAPSSVIVNEKYEIVHFRGPTGPYLAHPTGEASFNILRMVREGLRIDLRSAIHKAFAKREKVVRTVHVERGGQTRTIRLTVQPFQQKAMEGLAMVIFEEVEPSASADPREPGIGVAAPVDQRTLDLEQELNTTKESLQTTIEELETSNEELKSANEELQSTNEELQSTNEELETSKEELQSINEELVTVNAELQTKIDELSQANNDMMNLLSSTDVGTIFLDSALRIKRFTPAATNIIHLIPSDLGRPISHITANLVYENLAADIEQVLRTLVFKQTELQTREGEWYLMKIFPYRTMENRIEGVIITFVNITELKRSKVAQKALLDYTHRLIETMNQPLVILSKRLRFLLANDAFYKTFRIQREEIDGQVLFNLGEGQWNIPDLKKALEESLTDGSATRTLEVEHTFPLLGKKRLKIDLHKIDLKENAVIEEEELILLFFEERPSL